MLLISKKRDNKNGYKDLCFTADIVARIYWREPRIHRLESELSEEPLVLSSLVSILLAKEEMKILLDNQWKWEI